MNEQAKKKVLLMGLVFLLLLVIWGVWNIIARGTSPTAADFNAAALGTDYESFRSRFDAKPSKELTDLAVIDERIDLYDYYFSDQYEKAEGMGNRYLFFVTQEDSVLGFGFGPDGTLTQKDLFRTDLSEDEAGRITTGMSREEVVALLGSPHTHLDGFEGYKATKDTRWFALRYEDNRVAEISWDLQK